MRTTSGVSAVSDSDLRGRGLMPRCPGLPSGLSSHNLGSLRCTVPECAISGCGGLKRDGDQLVAIGRIALINGVIHCKVRGQAARHVPQPIGCKVSDSFFWLFHVFLVTTFQT